MPENGSNSGTKVVDKGIECGWEVQYKWTESCSKLLCNRSASRSKVRYKRFVCGLKMQDISSDNGTKVLDKGIGCGSKVRDKRSDCGKKVLDKRT